MKKNIAVLIAFFLLGAVIVTGCSTPSTPTPVTRQVKNGNTVQVHYTGKLSDGTVFDSSIGQKPLEFTMGEGQLIPGFEKAVLGMKVGEKKTVTIASNEAYGPYRKEMVVEIPLQDLKGITPQIGMLLQSTQKDGSVIEAVITRITETTVTLDSNPPLAGKDLTFEIELIKILN